jgi:cytochrome c
MLKKICATLVLMALAFPAWADGDAAAGKAVFRKCAICHSPSQGQNRVGPSLYAVYGRPAGIVPSYSYSDAMKNSGKVWNPATLDTYLTNPRALVPGNKMSFAGLPNAADRANVIAYLATVK